MLPTTFARRSLLAMLATAPAAFYATTLQAEEDLSNSPSMLDLGSNAGEASVQLQAIGGLGVAYLQSTLGLIGVIADTVNKDIYSKNQVENLMTGTINGLEAPKKLLRKLQDSNITSDDAEFLDRMFSIFNALQREARSLVAYSKSRKPADAEQFERDRQSVLRKLADLTQQEQLLQPESVPNRLPNLKAPTNDAAPD